ncbi:hypothetical protein HD554DRAFT_2193151 [Boletus coccyginus]|nr:hypothetical protein HD554DRAFT_2193151 [Boletus coccyginus]
MTFASFASFAVLSLRNALGVPSTKFPIDNAIFVSYVLPPLVCYFVVALLAVTPQTRTLRVAVWPLVALLSLRAALSVDMSLDKPGQKFLNLFMLTIATRTLGWTLPKEPLLRHLRPANSAPSTILDALDLGSNVRGHGWDWSGGLYVPRQTRPANRAAFVFSTFLSAIVNTLICGALHRAILMLAPVGGGPIPEGSTIFDETLPFLVQYLRAAIISALAGFAICAVVQMNYDLGTMVAVLVLGQDPAQWPPILDAPWRATSLGDFWGRRWHQMLRQTFLLLGGYPLSFLLGRAGIVIGAFLASGVVHHIMMVALGNPTESWRMLVGFGMMAPGILLERAFQQLTGRRVGGVVGWVWTMGWVLLWGNLIVEEFARTGMYGSTGFVDSVLPVRIPVERLVIGFDGWLHTI